MGMLDRCPRAERFPLADMVESEALFNIATIHERMGEKAKVMEVYRHLKASRLSAPPQRWVETLIDPEDVTHFAPVIRKAELSQEPGAPGCYYLLIEAEDPDGDLCELHFSVWWFDEGERPLLHEEWPSLSFSPYELSNRYLIPNVPEGVEPSFVVHLSDAEGHRVSVPQAESEETMPGETGRTAFSPMAVYGLLALGVLRLAVGRAMARRRGR